MGNTRQQSAIIFHPFHPQGTLRPIFESQLKQKRLVRNRAISLRRKVAEAGLDYGALEAAVKDRSLRTTLEATGTVEEDIEEIVKLIEDHFCLGEAGDLWVGLFYFYLFLLSDNSPAVKSGTVESGNFLSENSSAVKIVTVESDQSS